MENLTSKKNLGEIGGTGQETSVPACLTNTPAEMRRSILGELGPTAFRGEP